MSQKKKEPRTMAKEAYHLEKEKWICSLRLKKKTCEHLLVLTLRQEIREVYQTTVAPEFCLFDSTIR